MKKVQAIHQIPEDSIIAENFGKFHYCDSYRIAIQTEKDLDKITTEIFQTPKWTDVLMSIRNSIVRLIGLNTGGKKKNSNIADYYPVGSRAVYFTVVDRSGNEIIMAENDKHLDFKVSVLANREGENVTIYLTTLVKYNNLLGRLYFFPVKPFHRIIVISLLKRLLKNKE